MVRDLETAARLVFRNLLSPVTCAMFAVATSLTLASAWRWAHGQPHTLFPLFLLATVLFGLLFALAQRRLKRSFAQLGATRG